MQHPATAWPAARPKAPCRMASEFPFHGRHQKSWLDGGLGKPHFEWHCCSWGVFWLCVHPQHQGSQPTSHYRHHYFIKLGKLRGLREEKQKLQTTPKQERKAEGRGLTQGREKKKRRGEALTAGEAVTIIRCSLHPLWTGLETHNPISNNVGGSWDTKLQEPWGCLWKMQFKDVMARFGLEGCRKNMVPSSCVSWKGTGPCLPSTFMQQSGVGGWWGASSSAVLAELCPTPPGYHPPARRDNPFTGRLQLPD